MGRKRSKAKRTRVEPGPEPQWETEDVNRMLGCLDFSLKNTDDKHVIKQSIVNHLKNTRGKKFSLDAIEAKLRELERAEPAAKAARQSVFRKGSSLLKGLDSREIKKYATQLQDHQDAQIMQAQDRHLRYTPQRAQTYSEVAQRGSYVEARRSVSTSSRAFVSSATPAPRNSLVGVVVSLNPEGRGPAKRRRRGTSHLSAGETCVKREGSTPWPETRPPSHDGSVPDTDDAAGYDQAESPTTTNSTQLPEIVLPEDSDTDGNDLLRPEGELLPQKLNTALKEIDSLRTRLEESSAIHEHTSRELSKIQQQYEEISDTALSQQYALSQTNQRLGEDSVAATLAYQQRRIISLERLLKETRESATFLQLGVNDSHGQTDSNLAAAIRSIDTEIKNLTIPFDSGSTFHIPPLEGTNDLSSLIYRCLGLCRERSPSSTPLASDLEILGLRATLCAITAAALCEWVFDEDFERRAVGNSILLEEYRHHLSFTGERPSLRNLDLAAHKSIFTSLDYQQIRIPVRARALATRFSDVLAPVFQDPLEPSAAGEPPTWGLDEHEWYLVYEGLVDIFELALRLKVDLLLSTHTYTLVFFSPIAEFSKDWMQPESKNGDRAIEVPEGSEEVQLCVLPALFGSNEPSLGLVDYKVPVCTNVSGDNDLRLVNKGVVILSHTD